MAKRICANAHCQKEGSQRGRPNWPQAWRGRPDNFWPYVLTSIVLDQSGPTIKYGRVIIVEHRELETQFTRVVVHLVAKLTTTNLFPKTSLVSSFSFIIYQWWQSEKKIRSNHEKKIDLIFKEKNEKKIIWFDRDFKRNHQIISKKFNWNWLYFDSIGNAAALPQDCW
jgi:hypothetical protein